MNSLLRTGRITLVHFRRLYMRTLLSFCFAVIIFTPLTLHAAGSSSSDSSSSSESTYSSDDDSSSSSDGGYSYTTYGMRMAANYISDENFDKAIAQLKKETSRTPDNADAWNLLGFSLRKTGLYEEAEAAYTKALEIDPKHTRAMEYMGELYLTLDMPEKTKALLGKLNALCVFNCKDRDLLKKALADYEAKS